MQGPTLRLKMAVLAGVRVIELAGLAPAPFAGMILGDFGASVTRIDRIKSFFSMDRLARGKRSIAINLQSARGVEVVRKLCLQADVLIEPFRPGVMEKLGLGPEKLMKENPGLIYARITGYGQSGPMARSAGHDINYIALSGLLSRMRQKDGKIVPPLNLLADFAGGGLMCALGILLALYERRTSGKGQVIDASMVEGASYLGSFVYKTQELGLWSGQPGTNLLDTGSPFYNTYRTADNKDIAVGALEDKFYQEFIGGLGLADDNTLPPQMSKDDWASVKDRIAAVFATKTQSEWCKIFENTDACVTPVLTIDEAPTFHHNQKRQAFIHNENTYEPAPAPKLSRTPADENPKPQPNIGEHAVDILIEAGYSQTEIQQLIKDGIVESSKSSL